MKKINIIRRSVITNSCTLPETEALAWLSRHEDMGTFGSRHNQILISPEVRGDVWVLLSEEVLNEYGEEISPALYNTDPDGIVTPAVYEAEYSVEIIDVADQHRQDLANEEAKAYLAATDWMVTRAMERGEPLSTEFKAEREAARARIVK